MTADTPPATSPDLSRSERRDVRRREARGLRRRQDRLRVLRLADRHRHGRRCSPPWSPPLGAGVGLVSDASDVVDAAGACAEEIGWAGVILVLVVVGLSYYCGGYVAGRMARFDGIRQGVAVFAWAVVAAVVVAVAERRRRREVRRARPGQRVPAGPR